MASTSSARSVSSAASDEGGCLVTTSHSSSHNACLDLPASDWKLSSLTSSASLLATSPWHCFLRKNSTYSSACPGSNFKYRLYTRRAVEIGTKSRRINSTYGAHTRSCCVTGNARSARSHILRVSVINAHASLTYSIAIIHIFGILCIVVSARSKHARVFARAASSNRAPRSRRARSVRYRYHSLYECALCFIARSYIMYRSIARDASSSSSFSSPASIASR
mmetsp:Transcript_6572/g.26425  ORF Transcript_6572/g.26425 Transcript_6572/m.26425 type:complete len:222 (+) Transcript_6572:1805-2470(+)